MIGFEKYSLEEIKKNKARILDLYKNILKDPNFNILVTQATSDTKVIEKRMKSWTDMLAKVMRG